MRTKTAPLAVLCLALQAPAFLSVFALQPPPEGAATGKKGPVQLTLRLHKTTVKVKKSLWSQLELKNIGKEKIWVSDRIFRDMWQLHTNCYDQDRIYIEVQAVRSADGKPVKERWSKPYLRGGFTSWPPIFQPRYDYIAGPEDPALGKQVNDRLDKLETQWTKEGLSELQKKVKRHDFWDDWNRDMRNEEDRAKSFWLTPGASTATAAWAYPGQDHIHHVEKDLGSMREAKAIGYPEPHDLDRFIAEYDVEKQIGEYAQLWFFQFDEPGIYKVRAVYAHAPRGFGLEFLKERGRAPSSWEVDVKTPYIEFQARP